MSELIININSPLKQEYIRLIREQISYAIAVLKDSKTDIEKSIHEARKSIKKIRALLKCVQFAIKRADYRRENRYMRDIKNLLSDIRESYVLVESWHYCKTKSRKIDKEMYEAFKMKLEKQKKKIINGYKESGKLNQIIIVYDIARVRLSNIDFIKSDYKSLIKGIKKTYRKGNQLVKKCAKNSNSLELHELRKVVKYLWYQINTFQNFWPELIGVYTKSFEEISDLLGKEHDLFELAYYLNEYGTLKEKKSILPIVLSQSDKIKSGFYKQTMLLFSEKPKFFIKKFESILKLGHSYQ